MQLKPRKIGNGYGALFPKQLIDEMALAEGSLIDVQRVDGVHRMTPSDEGVHAAGRGVFEDRALAPQHLPRTG